MSVYYENPHIVRPAAVAIGNFDGVHRGHRQLLNELTADANLFPVAITFTAHSLTQIPGAAAPPNIYPLARKIELLEHCGAQAVWAMEFTPELRDQLPEEFLTRVMDSINVRKFVIGYDFTFGKGGKGDADTIREFAAHRGCEIVVIPPVKDGDVIISSSRIRALIEQGECPEAAHMLGGAFAIQGQVVPGKRLGKTIGFPTVNISPQPGIVTPRRGVYATMVRVAGVWHPAVSNVGLNPTVEHRNTPVIESFLFHFNRELYGQTVEVAFFDFLRAESKFKSLEELTAQIGHDKACAWQLHNDKKSVYKKWLLW